MYEENSSQDTQSDQIEEINQVEIHTPPKMRNLNGIFFAEQPMVGNSTMNGQFPPDFACLTVFSDFPRTRCTACR